LKQNSWQRIIKYQQQKAIDDLILFFLSIDDALGTQLVCFQNNFLFNRKVSWIIGKVR
jgi:hypothetical protein